ncbi:MAG: DegV family protein [Clostridiales bacterium]|nr:DegV family protein [Clostridiales bacterium]
MSKTRIFIDSVCDISKSEMEKLRIGMIPLTVHFNNEQYIDKSEINCKSLFSRINELNCMPVTSQPSPDVFRKAFAKANDCDDIICITMTSESSGTYRSALIARDMLLENGFKPNMHIIDSMNVSYATGILAKRAAKMALDHIPAEKIVATIQEMVPRASIYFVLETLEYVKRGGRIGTIKATIGSLLRIKPILTFIKGIPTDVDRIRGMEQAKEWLLNKFAAVSETLDEVTVIHADSYDDAKKFSDQIAKRFKKIKINIQEIGAVLAVYAGPKALGLTFFEKLPRWT